MRIDTITITSLDNLVEAVRTVYRETGDRWWFRGQTDAGWDLVPKVWRTHDEQTERYLTNLFYQGAKLRQSQFPNEDDYAGWLALMQHYGLPTRLLDWSESVLIGAYFALKFEHDMLIARQFSDAAIWMLNPSGLNAAQGYESVFPSLNARSVTPLVESAFKTGCLPGKYEVLAAVPVNQDLRMVMQQGAFTVHTTAKPLNAYEGCTRWLKQLIIPADHLNRIGQALDLLGVRLSDVFPDLHHLSIDLTHRFRKR
jgi:hypothetical protein